MISLNSISFSFPQGVPIFKDFSWQAENGQAWAILGPSGSGKTTLLYLLAGLLLPTSGHVIIDGLPLLRPRPSTGLILQEYGLLPWATVRENAALGGQIRAFYGPDGTHAPQTQDVVPTAQVDAWVTRLGLAESAHKYPSQISGGQRQRTAIARTLVLNPTLLLMDEPFSSLDAPTREGLENLTLDLWREKALSLVIVTHSIEEAAALGRSILVLGHPPHTTARVVENSLAGSQGYRQSLDFMEMVRCLRSQLEDS